jgi:hypothetical protein
MDFEYNHNRITLHCVIEIDEVDRYCPTRGHYTWLSKPYIESATHNGQDISEILSQETIEDILEEFQRSQHVV